MSEGAPDLPRLRAYLAAAIDTIDAESTVTKVPPDRVNVPTGPDAAMEGLVFDPVEGWHIYVPLHDANGPRCVYLNTPSCMFRSDVVPLTSADARRLASALVAAADWNDDQLWRRRGEDKWLPVATKRVDR